MTTEKEILDKYFKSISLEFGVDDMCQEDIQENLDIIYFTRKELIEEIEDILNHSTQIPNELNYIKQKLDKLKEKKQ